MSRSDLARQRLKEIRTLQGFEAAYKAAGLPENPGEKRNTKVKRLSRLIKKDTGGFKDLTPQQRRKINRTYRTPTRQKALRTGRTKAYVRGENKVRKEARRKATAAFGEGGTNPDPDILRSRLNQFRNLTREEVERIEEAFENVEADGGKALRREYARSISTIERRDLPKAVQDSYRRRTTKANRAVWRDSSSDLTFEDWNDLDSSEKYGA